MHQSKRQGTAEVAYDYEAKTLSGRDAWLRRSVAMTRNQDGDVIAYTNVKDISAIVAQKSLESGMDAHIEKTINIDHLLEAMNRFA